MKVQRDTPYLNTALAAFIDILGFKRRVLSVESDDDLRRLHADVATVHRIFGKDPRDELTKDSHEALGKKVLALSDAVVVSIDFGSPLAGISGILDTLASELFDLALSQADAVGKGIFLRGGIAHGYHFISSSGDIMLSSAMVKAYETESKAFYPVLALEPKFYDYFCHHPGQDAYSEDIAPKNSLFMVLDHPKTGEKIACLDYFRLAAEALYEHWDCIEDLRRFKAEKDEKRRDHIWHVSHTKSALHFVAAHKQAIRVELAKPHPKGVMEKFRWLKNYHNRCVTAYDLASRYKI